MIKDVIAVSSNELQDLSNVIDENMVLMRRLLVSINVQDPELSAMMDAYNKSIMGRIFDRVYDLKKVRP
jgi:hypothetical protein